MKQKILITGASGVLGRTTVRAAFQAGLHVRQGGRDPKRVNPDFEMVQLDYSVPATIWPAVEGVSGMVLMAPPLDPNAPAKLGPVIAASKTAEVQHIVFISAFGANYNEQAPLRIVEHMVMDSGIPYTVLRPNFFMENFSEGFLSGAIKDQNGIFLAAGDGKTSFISVRDISSITVKCLTGNIDKPELDLTGPGALDHAEIAAIISKVSGRTVSYHPLTEEQMVAGVRAAGLPEFAISYLAVLYDAVQNGYAAEVTGDVERVLGRPGVTFHDFAKRNAAAWMTGGNE